MFDVKPEAIYSLEDVASKLGVSTDSIKKLCERGQIPYEVIDGRHFIMGEGLLVYFTRNVVKAKTLAMALGTADAQREAQRIVGVSFQPGPGQPNQSSVIPHNFRR